MEYKLELVLVPVTDVDRTKAFYAEKLGFDVDLDVERGEDFRVVQFTPPGSSCSLSIGRGITQAAPGSVQGLHLVVTDIEAAHADLTSRGAPVSEIFHFGQDGRTPGPAPDRADYGSFLSIDDPDGNTFLVQEVGHKPR
ncbi:VOC family protein [Actinocorallia populi]|uniref:VOC family protein n=1 Tax=Actinocorallia populi TaxID=2079200 RepID=UPI000D094059|nr:VOC family protein [Actinocorallia populi]